MITHLEPDILECEVKWALGSISTNEASRSGGIPVELFQILKVQHSICQQIWKTQQCHRTRKGQFHSSLKGRQCQRMFNYHTIALISHTSKVMLKILQGRLQPYMNDELQDAQVWFRKVRGTKDHCQHPLHHRKCKRVPEKYLVLFYWLGWSLLLCGSQQTGKYFKRWEYQTTLPASWEICMQV